MLEQAIPNNLAIVNTFFRNHFHIITFKSAIGISLTYYFLIGREDLKELKDSDVIPGESIGRQFKNENIWNLFENSSTHFIHKVDSSKLS